MDKKELKKKVLDWQDLRQTEEELNRAQFKLEKIKNQIAERKKKIFQEIEGFLENLLERQEVEGKKIAFVMSNFSKSWWIYSFEIDDDRLIIAIVNSDNEDPIYYKVLYCFNHGHLSVR